MMIVTHGNGSDGACRYRQLRIESSHLTGTLPPSLSAVTTLAWLSLSDNYFSGGLPEEWSALNQLGFLAIVSTDDHGLSGTIPSAISGMQSLWCTAASRLIEEYRIFCKFVQHSYETKPCGFLWYCLRPFLHETACLR